MEADLKAREEQIRQEELQRENQRKEYRKMLNKISFRREMPIFPLVIKREIYCVV